MQLSYEAHKFEELTGFEYVTLRCLKNWAAKSLT